LGCPKADRNHHVLIIVIGKALEEEIHIVVIHEPGINSQGASLIEHAGIVTAIEAAGHALDVIDLRLLGCAG
jgi:hypothetical protein